MLNDIDINTKRQYLDLFDMDSTLTFEEPENRYEDYSRKESTGEDMRLYEKTIKGQYTYGYTHTFPQRYKFEFRLSSGDVNGYLKVPLIDNQTLTIDMRARDKSKYSTYDEGFLPDWDNLKITTSGVYTTDMDSVIRYKRGLEIALHLKKIVDVWIAQMITADMNWSKEYLVREEK